MSEFKLTTPVAMLIFNRADITQQVFTEIAKAKPSKLLVVGDGPRLNRPGEAERVAEARAIIGRVDWDCEVLTDFSEINLGCKRRVSSGIDWIFEQVTEAIILEDDCIPEASFFRFCQEMLERYRDDYRIGMVSGDNFQFGRRVNDYSYYFSKYFHIWGWATWRDRWTGSYDVTMRRWPDFRDDGGLFRVVGNAEEAVYWKRLFDRVYRGEIDTWDYQWVFANWQEDRMSILPAVNLVTNVGFGRTATHTRGASDLANLERNSMTFPLTHPENICRNIQADQFSERKCFRIPLMKRVHNKLAGLLR